MKQLTLIIMLASAAFGQKPGTPKMSDALTGVAPLADVKLSGQDPIVTALRAENEALKARLAVALQNVEIEKASCATTMAKRDEFSAMPEVMRTRLAAVEADAKKAAGDKKEPPK